MGRETLYGLMDAGTKANTLMTRRKVMESLYGRMGVAIRASGRTASKMDGECILARMGRSGLVFGARVRRFVGCSEWVIYYYG